MRLAGQSIGTQRPPTACGVTFPSLSDEAGLVNVVIMPATNSRDKCTASGEALMVVEWNLERRYAHAACGRCRKRCDAGGAAGQSHSRSTDVTAEVSRAGRDPSLA